MTAGPVDDAAVPAFWRELGLPGLVDVHVHFMPERVLAKVRAYFDSAGPLLGREWPITYREDDQTRLDLLRRMGIRRFTALAYAHREGMAAWLNTWTLALAAREPDVVPTATFHAEPSAAAYVRQGLEAGAQVWKVHAQVGDYDVSDPVLDEVWGLLAEARAVVVAHVGSGPAPGRFTGPGPVRAVLGRHPSLRLVVAHMGMPEHEEFLAMAEQHEHVGLDTTMAFTEFFPVPPPSRDYLARVRDLGLAGRVVLGTDFPNIPHAYAHQLQALADLDLGDDWLRAVCHDNGAALVGSAA